MSTLVNSVINLPFSLSSSQLKLLMELKVKHVYSMWKLLTEWMKDRVYNFHYLPINMKVRLGKKAVDNLENLPHSYDGRHIDA